MKTKPNRTASKLLTASMIKGVTKATKPGLAAPYLSGQHGPRKVGDYIRKRASGGAGPSKKLVTQGSALNYSGMASMKTRR